ncbi:hypothetical protein EMMF5_004981 [Cystobasidiomycetes sp. EMM_F5]
MSELATQLPGHQISVQQPLSSSSSSSSSASPSSPSTGKSRLHPERSNPSSEYDASRALSLLRSQPSHYIVASLYQRRYLLTPRDILTVPRLKDVRVGDIVSLDRVHEVGSRDYTVRASQGETLGKEIISCKATVIEHTKAVMQATVKFKKRKGYQKTIKTKPMLTRLRINDFVIGNGNPVATAQR